MAYPTGPALPGTVAMKVLRRMLATVPLVATGGVVCGQSATDATPAASPPATAAASGVDAAHAGGTLIQRTVT